MTVRSCDVEGKPGYQWRPAAGASGPCHTYDPDDIMSKRVAIAAAARDANDALEAAVDTRPL